MNVMAGKSAFVSVPMERSPVINAHAAPPLQTLRQYGPGYLAGVVTTPKETSMEYTI